MLEHRVDDVHRDASDRGLGAIRRATAGGAHVVLHPIEHDGERGVHHLTVGVDAERDREEERPVGGEAVVEVAVVETG